MKTIPAALQASLDLRATTVSMLWRIDRTDGLSFYFTDHDVDIVYSGHTYLAATSFTGSAIQEQLGLAVSNLDILGVFNDDSITEEDLIGGRYDGATMRLYMIDWSAPGPTTVAQIGRYTLGQTQMGDLAFQAEMRSLAQHFAQHIGALCSPKCRTLLGMASGVAKLETGCNFTMPAAVTGTIAAITDRKTFQVSAAGSYPNGTKGSLSGGYFSFGTVKFTNNNCSGIAQEVLDNDASLNFTMRLPFPLDFAVGDAVEMQIGCDRTAPVCANNFNNIVNFRGEPYVPGTDKFFRVNIG